MSAEEHQAEPVSATRGRPRDPAKREALLAAGRTLFVAHGFGPVTVDQVIVEAGVSRATYYAHFQDKMALLEAIVARESTRIVEDGWVENSLDGDLEEALTGFGVRLLGFLADPDMLAMERLAASAAAFNPNLGRRLFDAGPGRAKAILGRLLAEAQGRGTLGPADRAQALSDLMGLWQGMLRVELNFGLRGRPSPDEIADRARHGARQFLKLYGRHP